jgi:glycosyltransferase involved in cell wall biosynthesis
MPTPTPQRLLMTADPIGGVWSYALTLAQALQPFGIEIVLATMGAPLQASQRAAVQRLDNLTLCESTFKLEWMHEPWEEVEAAGDWLLHLARQVQPQVAHLNGYVHAALPWPCPTLVVGHSCVISWYAAVKNTAPPALWQRYRRAVARGLRRATRVTAPTTAMLAALHAHYGTFAAARAIPNGCRPPQDPMHGVSPDAKEPFIFTAGRVWDEAKNIAALDHVAPRLPWPVYVAGDTRHPDGTDMHLRHVIGLGRLTPEEVAMWLRRAAIFALPARYEPFGLSALEAGLAACALVLGDIPSLREVWHDTAIFAPPEQPEALAAALSSLIGAAPRRRQWARRARARAQQFTPERMAQGYMTLYRQLIGTPG